MTHDRIAPIVVITPVPRWWAWWLRLTWPGADRSALIKGGLLGLRFIHVAHWGLLRRRDLPTPYLIFQSNYDGPVDDYAESFAIRVPGRIRGMWQGAHQFPGPWPLQGFVGFILRRALPGPYHYHAAYPEQTVRTVAAAAELRGEFERFSRDVEGLDADGFAAAWTAFLTRQQYNL
jgi:hypothetical protein